MRGYCFTRSTLRERLYHQGRTTPIFSTHHAW